jgi:peptidyl-prolyl cis-trans isomerase D
MISWMQRHRKYLVITIWISTIAFIAAGSLGWGAYSGGSGKSDVIAKVGSVEITNSQFQSTYSRVYDYYNQLFNGGLTKEKAKSLKLQEISLEQLINNALLLNYAKDLGMSVSD